MLTEDILKIICKAFEIKRGDLCGRVGIRQMQKVVESKQVAAYFLWRRTRLTREQIANILDYGSKQAVVMADKKVKEIMTGNHAFSAKLDEIEKMIIRN